MSKNINKIKKNKKVVICRVIGNELPFRHVEGYLERGMKLTLEREPTFMGVSKIWILNRIVDNNKKTIIKDILKEEVVWDIPFLIEEYFALRKYKKKVAYLTNINPARNLGIRKGFSMGADAVISLDGGCCFDRAGLLDVLEAINNAKGYLGVHTWRLNSFAEFENSLPNIFENFRKKKEIRELMVVFLKDYDLNFNESKMYGNNDKAELLRALGLRGMWSRWWSRQFINRRSDFFGKTKAVGYCCRWPSGNLLADTNINVRSRLRKNGIKQLYQSVETSIV